MLAGLHVRSVDVSKDGEGSYTVTVNVPSGQTIHLYEADHFHISWVRPNIERVCVLAYPREGVERISANKARIEAANSPPTKWNYDLYGRIEKIGASVGVGDTEDSYLLDVGDGTVLVHNSLSEFVPSPELPLVKGDWLFVPTVRLELHQDQALNC
ncbi:hypothetical protein [Haloglomus salinum]|uniref:hypothetical protein n=1 Tax=Haloglomus salinum TaxID=2962673 RepID=UPI0020C9C2C7|nr:hypothetical protein [Haloglomus salinum]